MRAAFELFTEKGFDETTTREIALRAGVAVGTVFLYGQDKMSLCLVGVNDEIEKLNDRALLEDDSALPILERAANFFRPRYEFWSRHPKLSRAAAREMAKMYSPSEGANERERGIARRSRSLEALRRIPLDGIAKGELRPGLDADMTARVLYDIYLIELRFWLSADYPQAEEGLRTYLTIIEFILSGLRAPPP